MGKYTTEDQSLLNEVRADILSRPGYYEEGKGLLASTYSLERVRDQVMKDWREEEEFLKAQNLTGQDLELLLPQKPTSDSWGPGARVSLAIEGLREAMAGECSMVQAKAVLLLSVMMKFKDADQWHPVLDVFGPWGMDEHGKATSMSRWVGQCLLHEESAVRGWMENVRLAWGMVRPVSGSHPGNVSNMPVADDSVQASAPQAAGRRSGPRTTMHEIQGKLIAMTARGEIYTNQKKLAKEMGVSVGAINSAINNHKLLLHWMLISKSSRPSTQGSVHDGYGSESCIGTEEEIDAKIDADMDAEVRRLAKEQRREKRSHRQHRNV